MDSKIMEKQDTVYLSSEEDYLTLVENGTLTKGGYTITYDKGNNYKVPAKEVPTKTSNLINDSGFIDKSVNDLTNYTKTSDLGDLATQDNVNYETQVTNKPTIPTTLSELTGDTTHRVVSDSDISNWNSKATTADINSAISTHNSSASAHGLDTYKQQVAEDLQDIREVAEGKTNTFVINDTNEITGTQDADGNYTSVTAITGITLSDLKIGDNIYVKNVNQRDYWVSQTTPSVSLHILETGKLDLSDYVQKTRKINNKSLENDINLTASDVGALPDTTVIPDISTKMDKANPTGTGSFSLNRKSGTTIGNYSFAEGSYTTASGAASHAEGAWTVASSQSAHAEGQNTTASGYYSHAEGCQTTASAFYSHAEGSYTTAKAYYAHAEGDHTFASGEGSHSEGSETIASGDTSHSEGKGTTAQRKSQHTFGEYNIADTQGTTSTRGEYVEIVGNGTDDDSRSNARTLDWNGNEELAGNLKAAGLTDGTTTKTMTEILEGGSVKLYSTTGQNTDGAMTQKATTEELNLRPKAKDAVSTPIGIDPFANYYTKNEINAVSANVSLSNISPPLTRTSLTIGSIAGIKTTGIRFIIESWLSNDSLFGYIIWSDGYCEQWGKVVGGTDQVNTVSFLKSFREIPQVYVSRIWRPGGDPGNTTVDRRQICISNIPTTSSFNIWTNGWNSIDIFWKANGYINL